MTCPQSPEADPATLKAWCDQAAAGDTAALERLLWAYRGRLVGFARRKIGTDWHGTIDQDDLLQDAYINIFQSIASFAYRDEDSFYHWAVRIIDHEFIDHVRRLRRKKRDAAREAAPAGSASRHASFFDRHFRDSTTASRIMRREDAVNALMTCVAKLPDEYRLVVRRYHLNQEPLAAIAADLGRSEDAVRRMAGRAVERLAACLREASRYLSSHS